MNEYVNTLKHIIVKLIATLQSWYGCTLTAVFAIWNFVGDEKLAFKAVFIAVLLDMLWGIIASISRRKFVLSYLARETVVKVGAYLSVMLMLLFTERTLNFDWFIATKIIAAIICACELISISANILIIKPNFPFFCLFTSFLQGEISTKLGFDATRYFKKHENRRTKKNCEIRNTEKC